MLIDCFPFFNELDILELRLNELWDLVDKFVIVESRETYGGTQKPLLLEQFGSRPKVILLTLDKLEPVCTDRTTGRLREAYQRNALKGVLESIAKPTDIISFGDCDEIPNPKSIAANIPGIEQGIKRFKQYSFYYNVETMTDYGHDWASRARVGTWKDVQACGSMYDFRMFEKNTCPAIEEGGWHFSYFGGVEAIKTKVASMSPFLSEYKLFGDDTLSADIAARKDLHHRRCELPETFEAWAPNDPRLPQTYLNNYERYANWRRNG